MKKLLYTALLINAVLLTGCQVTGEKTGLFQKILGGSFATGVDTKSYALVSNDNVFSITVPESESNVDKPAKGLVGSNDFYQMDDRNWRIKHYFYSKFRNLHSSLGKLNLCHEMSPNNRHPGKNSSRSCSDVSLNYSTKSTQSGFTVTFKASELLVSTDNYAFFMENNAPNLLLDNGRINTTVLASQLAYRDKFTRPLNMSVSEYQHKFRKYEHDSAKNPIVEATNNISLSNGAEASYFCFAQIDRSIGKPIISCNYIIFGSKPIYDYRELNTSTLKSLKAVARNFEK